MLREKRVTKKPVSYMNFYTELESQAKRGAKKYRNLQRCEFQMIPAPPALIPTSQIYPLYGDIILIEKNGIITPDLSALTRFCVFRNIEVTQKAMTKLARIRIERKEETNTVAWDQIVSALEAAENIEKQSWARLIKEFSLKYDSFIKELQQRDYRAAKTEAEEIEHTEITDETEKKMNQLLEFFPCLYIKFRFQGSNIHITEISLNELLLKQLGYTLDTFVTSVFQEGLPQLIGDSADFKHYTIQTLLQRYFSLDKEGVITPQLNLSLVMKSGFIKNVQAQAHLLMNYNGGKFGIDLIFSVINKQEPLYDGERQLKKDINKDFIKDMAEKEKKSADFLARYYNEPFTLRYRNFEKVCTIRELPVEILEDEDDLIKKVQE